jgi:hypothetical protein
VPRCPPRRRPRRPHCDFAAGLAGFEVPQGLGNLPPGRARWQQIPAIEAAVIMHEGPFDGIDRTYGALGTVVAERAIGVDGPIREYYVVSFGDTDDEEQYRTEVCWPVFLTAAT